MKYKVRDRVEIVDINGVWHKATVYNVNEYRPPELAYAVDVDGINSVEPIWCGEDKLRLLENKYLDREKVLEWIEKEKQDSFYKGRSGDEFPPYEVHQEIISDLKQAITNGYFDVKECKEK